MKSLLYLSLVFFAVSILAGEKKELPPIEEVLKKVPKDIIERLNQMPMEAVQLPGLPEELKKSLQSIELESTYWKVNIVIPELLASGGEICYKMYKWIPYDIKLGDAKEYMKRYTITETMSELSWIYADTCLKVPVDKATYAPLIEACITSKCELKGVTELDGYISGVALVIEYKKLPRFVLGIGYPARFEGTGGPFHTSIEIFDLNQDLSINKIRWVDNYELHGDKADQIAIDFWKKLGVGVWLQKFNKVTGKEERVNNLDEIKKGGCSKFFVPRAIAKDLFEVEDYVGTVHRWNYNGHVRGISESKEKLTFLDEQIRDTDNPDDKNKLATEKEEELAKLKSMEAKLPELKKRVDEFEEKLRKNKDAQGR